MCVFCKIINGEIPGFKLYENDLVIAILDISQTTKGHTLIIPKRHVQDVFELSQEDANAVMEACLYVTKLLKEKLNVENVNLVNNSGLLAGQSVMHFHLHVIPRYEGDEFKIIQPAHEPDFNALKALCDLLNN